MLVFSKIKYPDKSQYIKPIASELLNNYQFIKNKNNKLLSKNEVINLLKESGCVELSNVRSNIVKTKIKNVINYYNHWFSATCITNKNKALDLRITFREKYLPDFRIHLDHSYCFDVMHKSVECYTQKIIILPSR